MSLKCTTFNVHKRHHLCPLHLSFGHFQYLIILTISLLLNYNHTFVKLFENHITDLWSH